MLRLTSLSITLALLLVAPLTVEAGPRGGARPSGGGNLGGARPSGGSFSGGNFSGGQNLSNLSRPSAGGSNLGSGDRSLQNLGGNSRLSSALEGSNLDKFQGSGASLGDRNAIGSGRPSNDQLNNFLGLDGARDNVNPANRDLSDRNLTENNLNLTDRNVTDRDVDARQTNIRQNNTNVNDRNVNINNNQINVNARNGQIYNNVSGYWNNGPKPFSPAWYAGHPNAWQYKYPHADAWAAASFGALAGWIVGSAATPTTYVYSDSYYYPEGATVEDQTAYATQQAADASQLASTANEVGADDGEQWMPLGVYAIVDSPDATSSKMLLQLAVSKSGGIAGTYYHALTGNSQPVHGAVDLKTQQVAWQIGDNQSVTFQTDLDSLTKDQTPVLIHYASGQTEKVEMVRMPDDSTKS
ncbi:hypothetical protein LOC68_13715 [Blastopirellula sp. JC732]|uniref:Mu-protocadherin-putative cell-suface protein n=1 Tax=Blastopirellula sediminis TaxID=2894196 RepID=A0A9X1MP34_9BACT|nr:hypothetical protein [Blastopirellula sediminis]MCC9607255.1 hypothetical protein [Blastopirellula sediminis]MCC9629452.1 hypothetical protein [Blastopirellula sediminis]